MDMKIPPLKLKIMLESNPLKSRILVWRAAVVFSNSLLGNSVFWSSAAFWRPLAVLERQI